MQKDAARTRPETAPQARFEDHPTVKAVRAKARRAVAPLTFERVRDAVQATVRIHDGTLDVSDGLVGTADITVRAPGEVWVAIVTKRRNPVLAVLTGRLKVRGDRSLLKRFAACFPR